MGKIKAWLMARQDEKANNAFREANNALKEVLFDLDMVSVDVEEALCKASESIAMARQQVKESLDTEAHRASKTICSKELHDAHVQVDPRYMDLPF